VTTPISVVEWSFFIRELNFEKGKLTITVGSDDEPNGAIVFEHVRSFLFFKESDFFGELSKYEHVQLIRAKDRTAGVYRLNKFSILEDVLRNRLDEEHPQYFWFSTPDECLEIVGFSEPKLVSIAASSLGS
jgi:hypothetical protein